MHDAAALDTRELSYHMHMHIHMHMHMHMHMHARAELSGGWGI